MVLRDLEQNDVNISKLFSYTSKITYETKDGREITFFQRLVGDEHFNQARVYALRKSAEMRANLHNPKWEERKVYVPSVDRLKKEELVNLIATLNLRDFTLRGVKFLKDNPIPKPKKLKGDATRKEQEDYQLALDKYKDEYSMALTAKVAEYTEERKEKLRTFKKEELVSYYEESLIEERCEIVFKDAFSEYTTYYGTYLNEEHTMKVAETLEDFLNFPTHLKEGLIENYQKLELDAFDLKKLQGVTP